MKAIVYTKYGPPDVLQLKEVEKPTPKYNEVLIRIYATTATAGDCENRRLEVPILIWLSIRIYMGVRKPKRQILGLELAGEIEAVGKSPNWLNTIQERVITDTLEVAVVGCSLLLAVHWTLGTVHIQDHSPVWRRNICDSEPRKVTKVKVFLQLSAGVWVACDPSTLVALDAE